MSAFDKVIGYKNIKSDMVRTLDVFLDREKYGELGVEIPSGMALIGEPGIGKTTLAKAFIEECGVNSYVIRKDKPNGDFVNHITETFDNAIGNAPSVILLDDLDKFANEDQAHLNAEEYVTVQACMDKAKGSQVFVIATMNETYNIPDSLLRVGRFDKQHYMKFPKGSEAADIMRYYLSKKKVSDDIDVEEIVRLFECSSCAELENLVNRAGMIAGYRDSEVIEQRDLFSAWKETLFDESVEVKDKDKEHLRMKAVHECGHTVVAEAIYPGMVNYTTVFVSVSGMSGGRTSRHILFEDFCTVEEVEKEIMMSLGGKAATEVVFGEACLGSNSDMHDVFMLAQSLADDENVYDFRGWIADEHTPLEVKTIRDLTTQTVVSRCYNETKKLIHKNRELLDSLVTELLDKQVLTYKDIARIKGNGVTGL